VPAARDPSIVVICRGAMGIAGGPWRVETRVTPPVSFAIPPRRRAFCPNGSPLCALFGRREAAVLSCRRPFARPGGASHAPARFAPSRARSRVGPRSAAGIGGDCSATIRKRRRGRPAPQDDARSRPQGGGSPSDPGKGSRRARRPRMTVRQSLIEGSVSPRPVITSLPT